MTWRKQYNLRDSDHFPIILMNEKKNATKQQRWSIRKAKLDTIPDKKHNNKTMNQKAYYKQQKILCPKPL